MASLSSSYSSSSYWFSSSSSSTFDKYDVFLSFSSLDMKENFGSHLCTALIRQYIKTFFIDHDNIPENEEMIGGLVSKAAIEKSKLSIIIFSKNYASSPWRLEELTHILECKGKMGHDVVPLFYNIEPSDVRTQQGSFATAFSLHEEPFKHRMEKLQQWRNALRQASNLVGWDISEHRSEFELVEAIVRDIQIILSCKLQSVDFKDLVGIEKRIEEIKKLLCIGSHDIRIVGIWGMGGIGKTTLAEAVYNHLSSQFEDSYFCADIREKSKKSGIAFLQRKIVAELFKKEGTSAGIPTIVEEKEKKKRVLLVLDDFDDSEQFELLAGEKYNQFGVGSRIIVTTRDAEVLRNISADGVYKVEVLNYDESMQLLHLNAFRNMLIPKAEYLEESKRIVEYSEGLPLAIKTLGSYLHARSKYEWQSAITKLRRVPDMDVQKVLRKSYDSLDHKEREAFLDIVCFHKGEDKEFVEQLLGCESFTHTIVDHLIDKCLVTIKHNKQLWMHNLVQQMGWEIVRQESIKVPGNRSRLWDSKDVYYVLQANKGTAATEGISLETSEISNVIEFSPTVFQEMNNLRLLKISSYDDNTKKWTVQFPQGLQSLPDALQYLHWDGYPLKCLPLNFTAKNLVGLILTNSHINDLPWHGVQDLRHLKLLDLSHSMQLTKIPDFYDQAPNLECICLQFCTSLAQVPSSLQHLNKLRILNLSGCSSITEFPLLPRNIRNLDLSCTLIRQVPSSIDHLCSLETLDLKMCENLEFLPRSIFSLKSLKELNIRGCTKLKYLPELPLYQENLNAKCCTLRGTEPTNSCSCLMFLSLVVDIFQHVLGRQSGSDKDPHGEEQLQAPEKVMQSIMMELGEHNKQISQHLQTVMPKTSHESFDSLEMSSTSRAELSHSTGAEKQLHETPEETIDSLCSQIIGVRDQNNKILQNLQSLLLTTSDDQFVGLFQELTPSLSAPSIIELLKNVIADEQHVQVPEEVIHSLQSNLTELRDQNQEILRFLCIAVSNSPTTTNRQSSQSRTTVTPEIEDGQDRRGSYKRSSNGGGGGGGGTSNTSPPSRSSTIRRQGSRIMRQQRSGLSKHADRAEEFSFPELAAATNNFSLENKLGAGSFGVVYRGKLTDGRDVAIKRSESGQMTRKYQEKESAFESELAFLSRLHHKHLVRLVGFCEEKDERLLVYEYMKNGALYDHLHGKNNVEKQSSVLNSWKNRIKIALDASRGIEYLHNYAVPPIIHRDIKSSNILLDVNWTAKVSDFGLSLMGPESGRDFRPTKAAGTVGYIDPEYYGLNVLTAKSDVYGLGVVLLELLTGKRAIFKNGDDGGIPISVVDFAVPAIMAGELAKVLDQRVGPPELNEGEAVELVAYTAMHCVNLEGKERPTMTDIVANLERALSLCDDSHGSISSGIISIVSE